MLPAFAGAIGNLWSICLRVNIFSPSPGIDLHLASDTIKELSLNNLIAAFRDS